MNRFPTPALLATALAAALLLGLSPARAGEGHDHGESAPVVSGPALPRFATQTESFELVGVLQGRHLQLYLDRSASNEPVSDAKLELEIAGAPYVAEPQPDRSYEVELPAAPAPGVLAITATVTAGDEVDLLAAELDLHGDEDHAEDHAEAPPLWRRPLVLIGAAAALALAAFVVLARRRAASSSSSSSLRAGGAA